jgi:preprotein translocase subunit SecF
MSDAVIQRYDRAELNQVMIRVGAKATPRGELDANAARILRVLNDELPGQDLVDESSDVVGPVVGSQLRQKALTATLASMLAMLIYIGFRFEPIFGVGATVALIHDVLVTLGIFFVFGYELSLNVIAAFLTLVGYSVNDTIVIFDRVRENRQLMRKSSLYDIINTSINQTLRRTILTSGLTFIPVASLFFFGGEALEPFAFVMLVGIIIGTYSTLGIASPIVMWWKRAKSHRLRATPPADHAQAPTKP